MRIAGGLHWHRLPKPSLHPVIIHEDALVAPFQKGGRGSTRRARLDGRSYRYGGLLRRTRSVVSQGGRLARDGHGDGRLPKRGQVRRKGSLRLPGFTAKRSDRPPTSLHRSGDKQDFFIPQPEANGRVRELEPMVEICTHVVDDVHLGQYLSGYGRWRQGEECTAV